MSDVNEMARMLASAAGYHNRHDHLALDPARMVAAHRDLNSYGVLSLRAIASITHTTRTRVERSLEGLPRPAARGKLNPAHLSWLAYMLDGKSRRSWVYAMVNGNTSISTIADITGISRSTLERGRK